MATRNKLRYMMLLLILWAPMYFGIQKAITVGAYDFFTKFDAAIPLIPQFVWVYHSLVPVIIGTMIWLVQDRRLFFTMLWSSMIATAIMNFSYIIFPAFYPREIFPIETLSEFILAATRDFDGANNTFPSSHVAFSWLIFLTAVNTSFAKRFKAAKYLFLFWAISVSAATLLLKQHYIIDVISGLFLSVFVFYGVKWMQEKYLYKRDARKDGGEDGDYTR
jgi:membrane-associated phospholipid phosphatase